METGCRSGFAEGPFRLGGASPTIVSGDFDVSHRRRLGSPGLRTFVNIASEWGLTEQQRLLILGLPSRSAYYNWVKTAQSGGEITLPLDALLRISAVLGIYKSLQILCPTVGEAAQWLRSPHDGVLFGGRPPLELLANGTQDGLMLVRRFLDAARGGLYMEPNAADRSPAAADDDIVFL